MAYLMGKVDKSALALTPSRLDGLDEKEDFQLTQKTAQLIETATNLLYLPEECAWTAASYVRLFYIFESRKRYNDAMVIPAAIVVAAKVVDRPRTVADVLSVLYTGNFKELEEEFVQESIKSVAEFERKLVKLFLFDLVVPLPLNYLEEFFVRINASEELKSLTRSMIRDLLLYTNIGLIYSPQAIACFSVYMVKKKTYLKIPDAICEMPWMGFIYETATDELINQIELEFIRVRKMSLPFVKYRFRRTLRMKIPTVYLILSLIVLLAFFFASVCIDA